MTEQEFVRWADKDVRAEWVDGEVIIMPPVNYEHADIGAWLLSVLHVYVEENELGEIIGPEFMVRFGKQRRRRVPDIMFVAKARLHLLQPNHFEGAPDLIVEVVSPDSESRDWRDKYDEYRKAGVREYWVVDPLSRHVETYALARGGKMYQQQEEMNGAIRSRVLRGFFVRTSWLWKETRPTVRAALRELGVR